MQTCNVAQVVAHFAHPSEAPLLFRVKVDSPMEYGEPF
jgi:hypothetical protein